jgi:RNA polymerase sigma-70 factor (ECF subfamily)
MEDRYRFARAQALAMSSQCIEDMLTDSDEALIRSAQGGDRTAFEELVRRTSRLVFARLYLETGDAHRAEDLLQETLLSAFRSLGDLAEPKGFRRWLLKIAQNVVLDAARRDLRHKRMAPPRSDAAALRTLADKEPSPEDQVAREELRGQVLAILRSLPEEYRLPLTLRYIGGADYATIQTQLGLSNGALRGLLHRGLKLLRAKLPRDFESSSGEWGASAP